MMMDVDRALVRLGESTAEAVLAALQALAGDAAQPAGCARVAAGGAPLRDVPAPAVAVRVFHRDPVAGGGVFAMPVGAARKLAAVMAGHPQPGGAATELTERELPAVEEAMSRVVAAAATATSAALGSDVDAGTPDIRIVASLDDALGDHDATAHVTCLAFTLFGEPCRLLQLVPNALVVRMTQAIDEMRAEYLADVTPSAAGGSPGLDGSMRAVSVRVWAELGRRPMPIGALAGIPAGAVLELDREADEPVDLYVNGLRFAKGRLVVSDGGEWAVAIDELVQQHPPAG